MRDANTVHALYILIWNLLCCSLLKVHLQLRGFSVFIDIERLRAGKFDENLLYSIKMAKNFILILTSNALDRCFGDADQKDWVHKASFHRVFV